MTDQEAYELIDFAAESRKRVKDQLYAIDETFRAEPAHFKYINLKTGMEVEVETLEKLSYAHLFPVITPPKKSELNDSDAQSQDTTLAGGGNSEEVTPKRPRITHLQEKGISFRLGQTGVSYAKLFAPYMENANEITVEDPYIRTSWQVRIFVEFVAMLIDTRPVDDLKLHLFTNEEEDKRKELAERLEEVKNDLANYGIEFDYKFQDFHDRCIKTDTGWTITLGRGLDIFDKYSSFSVEANRQDKRRCKDFTVTYMKNKD